MSGHASDRHERGRLSRSNRRDRRRDARPRNQTVLRIRRFDDAVFAATQSGLFRSTDGGATWTDLDVPRREVYSVLASSDGERLYVAHILPTCMSPLMRATRGADSRDYKTCRRAINGGFPATATKPTFAASAHPLAHPTGSLRASKSVAFTSVRTQAKRGQSDATGCITTFTTCSFVGPIRTSPRVVADSTVRATPVSRGHASTTIWTIRTFERRSPLAGDCMRRRPVRHLLRGVARMGRMQRCSSRPTTVTPSNRYRIQANPKSSSLRGQPSMR